MKNNHFGQKILSWILIIALVFTTTSCSEPPKTAVLSDPVSVSIVENRETETTLTEHIISEFITDEVYLEEIVFAEDTITELLLTENEITEVILCKTIYVPEANLEEFSNNSQTAGLFGANIDLSSVIKKIAIGTGVIITVVILKKVGFPDPIASVIISAADKSLQFAKNGALVGTLFGATSGAANEIDKSGRTSAVIGFALATAGLIISIVSLVAAIPTGGTTTVTAKAGVELVVAGIGIITAATATVTEGINAIKVFTSTDCADIDWGNIDWESAGVSAAERAINYGADGYMWGAIVGAVYGGADGYDYYHKYNTPYTTKAMRLQQTPKDGNKGHWTGERGESDYILDEPIVLDDGTVIQKVTYRNCVPDFSPYQRATVKINGISNIRASNYAKADTILAEYWTKIKFDGKSWTRIDVSTYRNSHHLTWHEMSNMDYMQLVPTEVNSCFTHCGGVSEYNAMIGEKIEYD